MRLKSLLMIPLMLMPVASVFGADGLQVFDAEDAQLKVLANDDVAASSINPLRMAITVPTLGTQRLQLRPNLQLKREAASLIDDVAEGKVAFYMGEVEGRPDSWVRLTRLGQEWFGVVQDGDTLWLVDPASHHVAATSRKKMPSAGAVIYPLNAVSGIADFHGDALLPPLLARAGSKLAIDAAKSPAQTKYLRLSLVMDVDYQQLWGSSASALAAGMVNVVDGFYSQASTRVSLHALNALAQNGTMTSTDAGTLLGAFSDYSGTGNVPFDGLAHLLSGKDFDGSTVGLAWMGVPSSEYAPTVCNARYGTGVDQITSSAALGAVILAHEMGHNYGAGHDGSGDASSCPSSGYIMAPFASTAHSVFSQCSLQAFGAYFAVHSPACVIGSPDLLFIDGFE